MNERDQQEKTDVEPAANCQGGSCSACWRLPLLLAVVLAVMIVVNGRGVRREIPGTSVTPANGVEDAADGTSALSAASSSQSVGLSVDFGDGRRQTWKSVAWREGLTVADALTAARSEDSGAAISFKRQGTDPSKFFLTELDGVGNEGAGQRNWTYQVNGERGDRSFAIYELKPGDQVLWTFGGPQ
jgi:hypothetical protein